MTKEEKQYFIKLFDSSTTQQLIKYAEKQKYDLDIVFSLVV